MLEKSDIASEDSTSSNEISGSGAQGNFKVRLPLIGLIIFVLLLISFSSVFLWKNKIAAGHHAASETRLSGMQESSHEGVPSQIAGNSVISDAGAEQASPSGDQEQAPEKHPPKIDAKILLSESKKENIMVTDQQVDDVIKKGLEAYSMSEEDLKQRVSDSGITFDEYKEEIKSRIAVSELVSKNVDLKSVSITDKEVSDYIESHKADFQDYFDAGENLGELKSMIRSKLLKEKQTSLVVNYVDSLKQN